MSGHPDKHIKTFDQVIADHVGQQTQFKSFQLSAEPLAIRGTPDYNFLSCDEKGRSLYVERNEQLTISSECLTLLKVTEIDFVEIDEFYKQRKQDGSLT